MTNKLLTPYTNRGNLTPRQRHFNFIHSGNRMFVERSFGLLRGKMRRLLKLYDGICTMPDQAPDPNRTYQGFEIPDEDDPGDDQEIRQEPGVGALNRIGAGMDHPLLQQAKAAGIRKGEDIADELDGHDFHH
ncbi:hypothetical protein FOCC_FOCC012844 [Frankliniella occidentalis]|nr:hypothetical protein FOCC_FOCC012844 [Frankliniella occidentalis]